MPPWMWLVFLKDSRLNPNHKKRQSIHSEMYYNFGGSLKRLSKRNDGVINNWCIYFGHQRNDLTVPLYGDPSMVHPSGSRDLLKWYYRTVNIKSLPISDTIAREDFWFPMHAGQTAVYCGEAWGLWSMQGQVRSACLPICSASKRLTLKIERVRFLPYWCFIVAQLFITLYSTTRSERQAYCRRCRLILAVSRSLNWFPTIHETVVTCVKWI